MARPCQRHAPSHIAAAVFLHAWLLAFSHRLRRQRVRENNPERAFDPLFALPSSFDLSSKKVAIRFHYAILGTVRLKSKDMTKLRKLLFGILLAAVLAGPMATPAGAIPGTQNSAHRSHTTNSRRKVHVRSHRKKSGTAVRAHKPAISQPK